MSDPTIPPRDAASLLLLQGEGAALRVLMGQRGAGHRFMPNRLVFPGGAVDAEDHEAVLARPPRPEILKRLGAGDAMLGRALAAAAARELQEETGLHLGHPPDLENLDYLCRAITPAVQAIRFDARFVVMPATHLQGDLAGSGELENLAWYSVTEALQLELAFPTRGVLEQLVVWLDMAVDHRRAARLTPTLRERHWADE